MVKTTIVASAYLSYSSKTKIILHESLQFSVAPKFLKNDEFTFYIKDVQGSFEISRIVNDGFDAHFDKTNGFFENRHRNIGDSDWFTFYISTDSIEFKTVASVAVDLHIPSARMKYLEVFECFEDSFVLPGHENLRIGYCVKKVSVDFVEVVIDDSRNFKIEGEYQSFSHTAPSKTDINLTLSFVFDPENLHTQKSKNESFDELDNVS